MSDPTIRLSSCRGDGRCPECCRSMEERGGTLALLPLLPCGCYVCHCCYGGHALGLLTEALQQRDTFANAQKRDLNESVEVCYNLQCKLDRACEERDAAIRERNALLVEVPERVRQRMADLAMRTRERDEARSEVRTLRLLVESQTEQVSRSAMDLYSAVQSEVAAEERADRAEALLREVLALSKCPAGAWCSCCATIRTSLLAKIREVVR